MIYSVSVYLRPPPAEDKKLWIIGAVIGGLAGFVIIIWCFLFVYFKCTRPPSKLPPQRPPHLAKIADIDQIDYKGRDVKVIDAFFTLSVYNCVYNLSTTYLFHETIFLKLQDISNIT